MARKPFPVEPPIEPMLAKLAEDLPDTAVDDFFRIRDRPSLPSTMSTSGFMSRSWMTGTTAHFCKALPRDFSAPSVKPLQLE